MPGARVFSQTVLPATGAPVGSSIVPAKVTLCPVVGAVLLGEYTEIKEGDVVESFEMREIPRA